MYTFKKYCKEDRFIELDDGITSIFLNANGDRREINNALGNVLDYIKTGDSKDNFTKGIAKRVDELNGDDEWRDRHMTFQMKLDSVYERGIGILIVDNIEEGKTEEQIVNKLVKKYEISEKQAKEYYNRFS